MPNAIYDDQQTESQHTSEPTKPSNLSDDDKAESEELSKLERTYDEPSREDKDRNTNNPPTDSKQPGSSSDLFKPSGQSGGGGRLSNLAGIFKRNPKNTGVGGLGLAGILTLGVFVALNIGPAQFIHLSQMMQEIHFSDSETTSNNRVRKLIQYIHTKDVTKTRLGFLGNKIVADVDKKLKASGWVIDYGRTTGVYKGMVYDPSVEEPSRKASKQELDDLKYALEKEAGAKNIKIEGGKLTIPPGKGFFSSIYDKKIIAFLHGNNNEHGKIISAIQKRNMNKRAGIHFNPVTRLDNEIKKVIAEKIKKWQEQRKASKNLKGASAVGVSPKPGDPEEPDKPKPINDNAGKTDDLVKEASSRKLTAPKLAGAGAAGIGLLCIAKNIASGADESRLLAAKIALMKEAAEFIGVGNKAMAGDDIDMEVLDELNTELNGVAGGGGGAGSWTSANSLQPYQNSTNTGTKLPDELNPNPQQSEFTKLLSQNEMINNACNVIDSGIGQAVSFVVGIATGPISFTLTSLATGPIINTIQAFLSTDPIDMTKYSGGVKGEAINVGSAMLANESNSAMGGWAISDVQVAELQDQYQLIKNGDNKNRSIADKYLNPYKYDTIAGRLIDQTNTSKVASSIISIPSRLISSIPTLFNPKAKAASVKYSELFYGMNKISFPVEALNAVENPYQNAAEVQNLLKGSRSDLVDRLKTCNKITVDPETLDFTFEPDSTIPSFERLNEKNPECKSMNDPDFNKLRIAVLDTMNLKAYVCYVFNDEDSCKDMVNDTSTSEQVGQDQEGTPVDSRFGPFVFPVQATQAEIKKGGWCWNKQDVTCHETEDYGYYASDILIKEGFPILSATDGRVVKVTQVKDNKTSSATQAQVTIKANDCDDSGNNLTCIGKGTVFWYGHLKPNSILVKVGDEVKAGQQIAVSGDAGAGDGTPHLHIDATDRKNADRGSCARETVDLCKALGFINIQPELYKSFNNIGKEGDSLTNNWVWPVQKDLKAGPCWNTKTSSGYHAGIDINTDNVTEGNPAVAAHDGVVVVANKSSGAAGNYLTIKTDDGIYYSYEHLTSFKVKVNDRVKANQPVGIVGKTGNVQASSAGHLHFVMAKTNTIGSYSPSPQTNTIDPLSLLPSNAPNNYKCIK